MSIGRTTEGVASAKTGIDLLNAFVPLFCYVRRPNKVEECLGHSIQLLLQLSGGSHCRSLRYHHFAYSRIASERAA